MSMITTTQLRLEMRKEMEKWIQKPITNNCSICASFMHFHSVVIVLWLVESYFEGSVTFYRQASSPVLHVVIPVHQPIHCSK